jgi:hypothetical protein
MTGPHNALTPARGQELLDVDAFIELVQSWLDQPCGTVADPAERHAAILRKLLQPLGVRAQLVSAPASYPSFKPKAR